MAWRSKQSGQSQDKNELCHVERKTQPEYAADLSCMAMDWIMSLFNLALFQSRVGLLPPGGDLGGGLY